MLRLLIVCCVCITCAGIADDNIVPGCSTSQVRKPNDDEQGSSQIEMKEITASQSTSQESICDKSKNDSLLSAYTNSEYYVVVSFLEDSEELVLRIYKPVIMGKAPLKTQKQVVYNIVTMKAKYSKKYIDLKSLSDEKCTTSGKNEEMAVEEKPFTSKNDDNSMVKKTQTKSSNDKKKPLKSKNGNKTNTLENRMAYFHVASMEFLKIREKLVSFDTSFKLHNTNKMTVRIVKLGLVLGNKVKQLFKSEGKYKKYLIDKTKIVEKYVPQDNLFKDAIDEQNNELLNKCIYKNVNMRTCITDILLFMHYFPEILRDSCNEYINIQDPYVLELVVGLLIADVNMTREMYMAICCVRRDNNYCNVMRKVNFTSVIMVSFCDIILTLDQMNDIANDLSAIVKDCGCNSNAYKYRQLVFIDKMLVHISKKMEQICSAFMNISEEELQKMKKKKREFDELKTLADLMIEGHDHLCQLIEWNIKTVNEGKKLDVINMSRDDKKLPPTMRPPPFFYVLYEGFNSFTNWFRRN